VKVLLLMQSGAGKIAQPKPTTAIEEPAATIADQKDAAQPAKPQTSALDSAPASTPTTTKELIAADALIVPPGLWSDPDVCWLTGAHVAGEHTYLVREQYEGLLWWLALPRLLLLAESAAPHRADAALILDDIDKALVTLEGAGYRLDEVFEPAPAETTETTAESATHAPEKEALETVQKTGPIPGPDPEELEPQEPVSAKLVGPKNPDGPPEEY
jgi:hypothetical protein